MRRRMMEFMDEKFALKSPDMKAGDYYMEHVMESLDGVHYFSKSSPKCVSAFGLQGAEQGAEQCSSPCGDRSGASWRSCCAFLLFSRISAKAHLTDIVGISLF